MLQIHPILFFTLFALAFFPFISAACNRTCGGAKDAVPFPFGFSADCPIRLNCSVGHDPKVQLGEFHVRNVTSDILLIDVPAACNRSIGAANAFFGNNYAMTANNTLLLLNCRSNSSDCVIPTWMLSQRLDLGGHCTPQSGNISCSTSNTTAKGGEPLQSPANVSGTGCNNLFSSVAYGADKVAHSSVEFGAVELGWWLDGSCSLCSANANCTQVKRKSVTGGEAVTCRCHEGFVGDGFAAGIGCRREPPPPRCNPSKYMSGGCGGTTRVGVLIGGIAAGAALMASLGLLCYFIRRRSSFSRIRKSTKRLLSEASCTVPFYPFKEIERATDGFSDENRLGTGAYGTVYVGKLHNNDLVAVKKIRHRDTDGIEQVMNEIKLLSSVSHPNLVRLLGCCIDRGEQILVYEYMPNGTLSQHLQRESSRPGLPWTVRLTIAAETAKAISHLHSAIHPPIYHRDIKSSNILLDYNFNSKVADFGLSRMIVTETSHISTAPQGTPGYLDPQYHQNFHLSDKSDVYSFGVVLVEIITALKVVDFNRAQSEVNLAALAIDKIGKGCVEEIMDPSLDPHRDAWTLSSIHKVAELAFRCLAFHRDMRPSMMEVADELEQIRISGWASTEENVFMSSASSLCSSPSTGTEKSRATKSRKLISVIAMEEMKVNSPVSVQDPWFSEQSSPSTNSLLGNVIQ